MSRFKNFLLFLEKQFQKGIKCLRVICASFPVFYTEEGGNRVHWQRKIVPWQIETGTTLPKTLGTQAVFTIRSLPSLE